MGIQREESIVSACMLKAVTRVGARRSKGETLWEEAFWSAILRQAIK